MLSHVNVINGANCTIAELAAPLARVTGLQGRQVWGPSKPDGAPRKLMDVSRLAALTGLARAHRLGRRSGTNLEVVSRALRNTTRLNACRFLNVVALPGPRPVPTALECLDQAHKTNEPPQQEVARG